MTGYQEILTDPSYAEQIVTLTYPHIGNTVFDSEDEEANQIWAKGLVIRDLPLLASNFRNEQSLDDYLKQRNILGIADIDTRKLTRILRDKGAQNGCIIAGDELDENKALQAAQTFPGLKGMDLAKYVSTKENFEWRESSWTLGEGFKTLDTADEKFHVVAYDFGVKRNILRMLVDRGCKLTVVPAQTSAADVLALNPDGIFLSNGPGDPEPCLYAIKTIQKILRNKVQIFGICLGHQLLALAAGAKTKKMKFGHHGANHPVQDLKSKEVFITSQNHGFTVDENNLPEEILITHRSLFDDSIQGIAIRNSNAFSFQGHPEASPGPHDINPLFVKFSNLMNDA
jgi:carbamoyl-phosphate synthase small subunit